MVLEHWEYSAQDIWAAFMIILRCFYIVLFWSLKAPVTIYCNAWKTVHYSNTNTVLIPLHKKYFMFSKTWRWINNDLELFRVPLRVYWVSFFFFIFFFFLLCHNNESLNVCLLSHTSVMCHLFLYICVKQSFGRAACNHQHVHAVNKKSCSWMASTCSTSLKPRGCQNSCALLSLPPSLAFFISLITSSSFKPACQEGGKPTFS